MKLLLALIFLATIWALGPPIAQAQVGAILEKQEPARITSEQTKKDEAKPAESAQATQATPAATTPAEQAGTTPAEPPELPRVTLQLVSNCETNSAESAILHMKGVVGVDIESKKGHMIVDYDPAKVTSQQLLDELARQKGCFAKIPSAAVGVTGK